MKNIIELETVDSTNTYAKRIAYEEDAADGTVVWAHEQTAGRGRQGNSWTSPVGNLYMSIIIRPEVEAQYLGQLAFLSAVALYNVLKNIATKNLEVELKWPNDVLLGGKKLSGILIEADSSQKWVVIGLGVNVASAPMGCASLSDMGFQSYTTEILMKKLSDEFEKLVKKWQKQGFGFIRKKWLAHAYNMGKEITVKMGNNIIIGTFRGIDTTGNLLLELPDGSTKVINSAEVFL